MIPFLHLYSIVESKATFKMKRDNGNDAEKAKKFQSHLDKMAKEKE